MEWVETTGRTLELAIDTALDQLGVDVDELEYEVITEPKAGLFGRFGGTDARIRARVKPISREKPAEKRRRRGAKPGGAERGRGNRKGGRSERERTPKPDAAPRAAAPADDDESAETETKPSSGRNRRRGGRSKTATSGEGRTAMDETATANVEDQVEAAERFLDGLLDAFDLDADVVIEHDDDTVEAKIEGADLGVLVGGRGATLDALGELTRTVVQRHAGGGGARIVVDVAGYRERRREALAAFATQLAETALETGRAQVLEPMSSADRKVVHDTVAEIDGVITESEGESERRRVVIRPA